MRAVGVVLAGLLCAASVQAAVPVYAAESPVYEAAGSARDLARKGQGCIAQLVRPALTTIPTLVSADVESGVIVANNALHYEEASIVPLPYTVRSTLTFEAREGRFRIRHTDIGVLAEKAPRLGWSPAMRGKSGFSRAERELGALNERIAACVMRDVASDW